MTESLDPCEECGHVWGQHDLIATKGDPNEGGIILCPDPGCRCYQTWSVDGKPKSSVYQPPTDEVDLIRADIQGFFDAHDLSDLDIPDA
jgi:hypothetical protein